MFHFQIESLALLSDESCYKDIREFYANNNEITSILKLEGTKFIDNFAILNLRANKLKNVSILKKKQNLILRKISQLDIFSSSYPRTFYQTHLTEIGIRGMSI